MYVHIRKLFRYWLSYVNTRNDHVQADLAVSFGRWKKYEDSRNNKNKYVQRQTAGILQVGKEC